MDKLKNDYVADSDSVKIQCERDWRKLRDVQAVLQDLEPVTPVAAVGGDPEDVTASSLQRLRELEKRLKAELQFVRERDLKSLPENVDLQLLVVEQDQVRKLDNLRETLFYLQALQSEVLGDIKQEEETYSSLNALNEVLKKKVAVLDDTIGVESGKMLEPVLTEMTAKVSKVAKKNKYFKDTLKEILSKHFPLPDPEEAGVVVGKAKDSDMSSKLTFMSVVGKLIEQSMNFPEQPYIDISDTVWPSHVEFLLRCQIALKDPKNPHRIKLVPFHL